MRTAPVIVALLALVAVGALVPAAGATTAEYSVSSAADDTVVGVDGVVVDALDATGAAATDIGDDELVEPCAEEPPDDFADPDENVIGWSDGYWYNEPIAVDQSDGLDEDELDALVARTQARFEALRCITAEESTPVELQSREEFIEEQEELFADINESERRFDNAKFETLLMIGADEDSVAVREANRGASVLGYYDPVGERIVVISEGDETLRMDEMTLAHELGHAIQDQQFDLIQFDSVLRDASNAEEGLIEGDVHLIEHRYEERCETGAWECSDVSQADDDGDIDLASEGLYLMDFQPYSDGPSFAESVYDRSGWDSLNDAYEDPPTTSRHIIEPETYPEFEPVEVDVAADPGEDWQQIETPDGPNYDRIGQAGIGAMFMAPTLETGGQVSIVSPLTMQNLADDGGIDQMNPFNYRFDGTTGWRGDRLVAYESGEETTTAWTIEWDAAADADAFVERYEQLAQFRGGDPIDDRGLAYSFEDSSEFDGVAAIVHDDSTTTVFYGPDLETIQAFNDAAAPEIEPDEDGPADDSDAPETADDPAADETADTDGEDRSGASTDAGADTPGDDDDEVPGFGVVVALAALLAGAVALARRR